MLLGRRASLARLLRVLVSAALLIPVGLVASSPTAHADTGLQVSVGYADNLRPNPASFPVPWSGSPNTVFVGSGSPWDAGAIKLDNNTSDPISVTSVVVNLHPNHGGPSFNLWGSPTIPPGDSLILTQTTQYDFDTSDYPISPCGVPTSDDPPQITVTFVSNSITVTQTYSDTGHVLDTAGYDLACIGNESLQWRPIGTTGTGNTTASLTLAPPNASLITGNPDTVVATLTDASGSPLANVTVDFTVLSGPNAGVTGSGTTDSQGHAAFTYTSAQGGDDTIQASITSAGGTFSSNTVTVTWVQMHATALTLNPPMSADYDDPVTLSATLMDTSVNAPVPLANMPITLSVGSQSCAATTDGTGMGACAITPNAAAGSYPMAASFAGDNSYMASNASGTFTVTLEQTTLAIVSSSMLANGQVTVQAQLKEDGTGAIAGRAVTFSAGSASATGTTDASGMASVTLPLAPGQYTLNAGFGGDAYYLPSKAAAQTLYVYQPTQFVIWGGNAPKLADAVKQGQDYMFWGAQWAKQVTAGDFQANPSFKGYADTVSGSTWSSNPGNASGPPATVGSYISVIVATHASKSGNVESGNIAEMVLLKVDNPSTYQPDPGHPGTGVMVAVLP